MHSNLRPVQLYSSMKKVNECLERDERRGRERLAVSRRHCTTRTPPGVQHRTWQRCRTRLCWRLRWWPLRWAAPGAREAAHSNFARIQHEHRSSICWCDATSPHRTHRISLHFPGAVLNDCAAGARPVAPLIEREAECCTPSASWRVPLRYRSLSPPPPARYSAACNCSSCSETSALQEMRECLAEYCWRVTRLDVRYSMYTTRAAASRTSNTSAIAPTLPHSELLTARLSRSSLVSWMNVASFQITTAALISVLASGFVIITGFCILRV